MALLSGVKSKILRESFLVLIFRLRDGIFCVIPHGKPCIFVRVLKKWKAGEQILYIARGFVDIAPRRGYDEFERIPTRRVFQFNSGGHP